MQKERRVQKLNSILYRGCTPYALTGAHKASGHVTSVPYHLHQCRTGVEKKLEKGGGCERQRTTPASRSFNVR